MTKNPERLSFIPLTCLFVCLFVPWFGSNLYTYSTYPVLIVLKDTFCRLVAGCFTPGRRCGKMSHPRGRMMCVCVVHTYIGRCTCMYMCWAWFFAYYFRVVIVPVNNVPVFCIFCVSTWGHGINYFRLAATTAVVCTSPRLAYIYVLHTRYVFSKCARRAGRQLCLAS